MVATPRSPSQASCECPRVGFDGRTSYQVTKRWVTPPKPRSEMILPGLGSTTRPPPAAINSNGRLLNRASRRVRRARRRTKTDRARGPLRGQVRQSCGLASSGGFTADPGQLYHYNILQGVLEAAANVAVLPVCRSPKIRAPYASEIYGPIRTNHMIKIKHIYSTWVMGCHASGTPIFRRRLDLEPNPNPRMTRPSHYAKFANFGQHADNAAP